MEQIRAVFLVLIWLFSVLVVLVVPFPIGVLDSKLNLKGNRLQEKNAIAIESPLEAESPTTTAPDGQEISMPMSNPRLRLFPFYPSQLHLTKKRTDTNRFFPEPQEKEKEKEKVKEKERSGNVKGQNRGGNDQKKDDKKIGGGLPTKKFTEKTVSLPNYKTDYLGNWVYNPWGLTYGQLFRDTRFKGREFIGDRPIVDSHTYIWNPKDIRTQKVCRRQSTGYNTPDIRTYLSYPYYHFVHKPQIILDDLRKELYKKGNPEECHVPQQIDWRTFTECMMMRHMRMEYLIPSYPLRQIAHDSDYEPDIQPHYQFPFDGDPLFKGKDYKLPDFKFPEVND